MEISFESHVRCWKSDKAPAIRYFVTLPSDIADKVKKQISSQPRKWFGSVKTEAMVGYYKRPTSIFPDKKTWSYLMCIKKDIRQKLQIEEGSKLYITLTIL